MNPITSCSKASRGLFVRLRIESIFTPVAISPSTLLGQFESRYAIRAGRNSPDKEFRSSFPFDEGLYLILPLQNVGVWSLRIPEILMGLYDSSAR